MPDIMTWFEMAQASGEVHVYLFEDRCTCMQHRRSSCRRCIEACPEKAITLEERKIIINRALCCGCGACSTTCPTEALVSVNPPFQNLVHECIQSINNNNSRAVIACARVVARETPNSENIAEVPCLCRVHESLLLDLVARGACEICLVDGGCKNCKYRHCDKVISEVINSANQMLDAAGSSVHVQRVHSIPQWVPAAQEENLGARRRQAFSQARGSAQGSIGRAVKFLVRKEKQTNSTAAAIVDALGVDLEEALPKVPKRQEKMVNALYEVALENGRDFSQGAQSVRDQQGEQGANEQGSSVQDAEPQGVETQGAESSNSKNTPTINTRFFASLVYDTNKCTECGICSAVCRHRALVRSQKKTNTGKNVFLEFTPSLCTQCHLCEDACYRGAMSVKSNVELTDLFSFEPTNIVIDV